ncbi:BA14K family protein [Rhizobiaceae bacterium n13]|uniref:Lectin-like protein BA14k n=1 Tax=Ferirhizobium litorale TaxID=2927786 RepID=A0AAE3QKD3_9HYPH|nr:BA14K family protein [Fererhizobium litorale]MDI7864523.1 BA14K family protein [Fererhizobium litorale]MDI7924936.1 BA14K family protein [Fererhizobium litorale]
MSLFSKLALGCVFGLSALSTAVPADAVPRAQIPVIDRHSDVTSVRVVCGSGGCNQPWSPGYYRRPSYRPYYGNSYSPYRPSRAYRPYYRPYYDGPYSSTAYIGLGFSPYYAGYYGGYFGSYYPYYNHYPRYTNRRVYPPPYYAPRTVYRAATSNSHQQWCQARYRSYNPASNMYLGYSGAYRVCRSPWN